MLFLPLPASHPTNGSPHHITPVQPLDLYVILKTHPIITMSEAPPDKPFVLRKEDDPAFLPFVRDHSHDADPMELIKKIILTPVIPIRFILALILISFYCSMVILLAPDPQKVDVSHKSQLWKRTVIVESGKFLSKILFQVLGFSITGTEAPGYDPVEAAKATIISNHVSMFDILLMMSTDMPAFVAKAAVQRIPFVGKIATGMQSLYVDRLAKGAGIVEQIGKRQQDLQSKPGLAQLLIFPEGTTTNGKFLLPFKSGAFVAGMPVAPLIIKYPYKKWSPSYETVYNLTYIYGLFTQFRHYIEYTKLPVYYPSEEEKKNPKLYAENVRNLIAKEGGFALSDSDYYDKLEYHAIKRNTPVPKQVIEYRTGKKTD